MIERLMNQERPYGEPEYSQASAQIDQLRQKLLALLGPEGRDLLEQLIDTSIRRESMLAEDTFVAGFCAAMELTLEVYEHRG